MATETFERTRLFVETFVLIQRTPKFLGRKLWEIFFGSIQPD